MKTQNLEKAKNDMSCNNFIIFLLTNSIVLLFGSFLQFTVPKDIKWIDKGSYITGIPFLRSWYLSVPAFISLGSMIYYILCFYNDKGCYEYFNKSLLKFLKKLDCFRFFTNVALFVLFYIIYFTLVQPINKKFNFKISGHVLATVISGSMLLNTLSVSENMYNHKIGKPLINSLFYYICLFILAHNTYSIIYTAWIYHHIRESISAFIITSFYAFVVNFMKIDHLVLLTISPELPEEIEDNLISKIN